MLRKSERVLLREDDVEGAAAACYAEISGLCPRWSGADPVALTFPETDVELCFTTTLPCLPLWKFILWSMMWLALSRTW